MRRDGEDSAYPVLISDMSNKKERDVNTLNTDYCKFKRKDIELLRRKYLLELEKTYEELEALRRSNSADENQDDIIIITADSTADG